MCVCVWNWLVDAYASAQRKSFNEYDSLTLYWLFRTYNRCLDLDALKKNFPTRKKKDLHNERNKCYAWLCSTFGWFSCHFRQRSKRLIFIDEPKYNSKRRKTKSGNVSTKTNESSNKRQQHFLSFTKQIGSFVHFIVWYCINLTIKLSTSYSEIPTVKSRRVYERERETERVRNWVWVK